MLFTQRLVAVSVALFLVSACGGGGSPADQNADSENATNGNATLVFDEWSPLTGVVTDTYYGFTRTVNYGATAQMSDVSDTSTFHGQGQWVAVMDDFSTQLEPMQFGPFTRTRDVTTRSNGSITENKRTTCKMPYILSTPTYHGHVVKQIAAGRIEKADETVNFTAPGCDNFYEGRAVKATLSKPAMYGVASEATVSPLDVDLKPITSEDANAKALAILSQMATIHAHLTSAVKGNDQAASLNLSFGSYLADPVANMANLIAQLKNDYPIGSGVNSVITVASGNNAKTCSEVNLFGCNAIAIALSEQDSTKDSVVVVGALTGPVGKQTIAPYTTLPGHLKANFLFASGDTGYEGVQGTSFAAPRVAGAAAVIKGDYPTLGSAQIVQLLLDSANRDMNNDGKPDFQAGAANAHSTWGRGKLDLPAALALAATRHPTAKRTVR